MSIEGNGSPVLQSCSSEHPIHQPQRFQRHQRLPDPVKHLRASSIQRAPARPVASQTRQAYFSRPIIRFLGTQVLAFKLRHLLTVFGELTEVNLHGCATAHNRRTNIDWGLQLTNLKKLDLSFVSTDLAEVFLGVISLSHLQIKTKEEAPGNVLRNMISSEKNLQSLFLGKVSRRSAQPRHDRTQSQKFDAGPGGYNAFTKKVICLIQNGVFT